MDLKDDVTVIIFLKSQPGLFGLEVGTEEKFRVIKR